MARRDELIAGFLKRRKAEAEPPKKARHRPRRGKRRRVPPRPPMQDGGLGGY
jgi:hypothetical protein